MRKEDFHSQLLAATFASVRFGQDFVKNSLHFNIRYVAVLNQSFDDNRENDEVVYPEDDGRIELNLTDKAVVDLLHRNERCPQWIDISVAGADKNTTLLRLLCCGRYHSEESRLYYYKGGLQPFGIKSPDLPVNRKDAAKFKVKKPDEAIRDIMELTKNSRTSARTLGVEATSEAGACDPAQVTRNNRVQI